MSRQRGEGEAACRCHGTFIEQGVIANPPEGVLRPGGLRLTRRLAGVCAFVRGAKIVDVGCGTGITVEYLRDNYGLCAAGVDIAEIRLQEGRVRTAGLPLMRADGAALPFADKSVDGVLAECSLSIMRDLGKVLAEMYRILAPGGKLAITDMYMRDDSAVRARCARNADCASGVKTYSEWTEILAEQGFCLKVWEDQSVYLKEFVARYIMEHGSTDALWQCLDQRLEDYALSRQVLKSKLGYFLLVAEKSPAKPVCTGN